MYTVPNFVYAVTAPFVRLYAKKLGTRYVIGNNRDHRTSDYSSTPRSGGGGNRNNRGGTSLSLFPLPSLPL